MKSLFTVFLLILPMVLRASDNRFRLHLGFISSYNVGQFNPSGSDKFLLSTAESGIGGNWSFTMPFSNNWGGGIFVSASKFYINRSAMARQIHNRYNVGDNYLTVKSHPTFQLIQAGIEVYKGFDYGIFTLEPLFRLAVGDISGFGDVRGRVKQKNDNYFDAYTFSIKDKDEFAFFYSSAGLRCCLPIGKKFDAFGTVMYSSGSCNLRISEEKTNLFREKTSSIIRSHQLFTSLQTEWGVDFRFGPLEKD
jgi:hypothetical protein